MASLVLIGRFSLGYCPICERRTVFLEEGEYLRDHYRCVRCRSIPRWRAVVRVLNMLYPDWRQLRIHEASPGGAASDKLRREAEYYTPTFYSTRIPAGRLVDGLRYEDLEALTFDDECFDLVITQDVMEHVLRPDKAFSEIARTLRPGGAHLFTVPYYSWRNTVVRAVESPEGITHLEQPEYHDGSEGAGTSLVVREWGCDLSDAIYSASGMTTTIYEVHDRRMGLDGEFLNVFVSIKRRGR